MTGAATDTNKGGRRERALAVVRGQDAERRAVICPGGMMSMAVTEVMDACGAAWPEAHGDADTMLALATAMQAATGFDSIAMPFCMTVEAERYGAVVEMGSRTVQPRVRGVTFDPEAEFVLPEPDWREGRAGVMLEALRKARSSGVDALRIGNVVGPFTLLGTLTDPLKVLRWTRRRPGRLAECLERLGEDIGRFALMQVEAGADCVCIAEPTATGEILGGRMFREFLLGALNRIVEGVRRAGAGTIVHMCGDATAIEGELLELEADAVSFDSMVDIAALARRGAPWRVMGNVSPFLLATGTEQGVRENVERLLDAGVSVVAPGCGIVPETPVRNLRAMSEACRGHDAKRDGCKAEEMDERR